MYASENFKIFNENAYFILVILMLFKKNFKEKKEILFKELSFSF